MGEKTQRFAMVAEERRGEERKGEEVSALREVPQQSRTIAA